MCFDLSLAHAKIRMSGSPLSPKFLTVVLRWSKSSAIVHIQTDRGSQFQTTAGHLLITAGDLILQ